MSQVRDPDSIARAAEAQRIHRARLPAVLDYAFRLMEPDMDIVPCFNDSSFCVIEPACLLKGALAEARGAFLAVLDRYTLADLAKPRRRLSALFPVEPRPV